MEAVELLNGLRQKMLQLQSLEAEFKSLDEDIPGVRAIQYDPDKVQSSPEQDGLERMVIDYVNKKDEIKVKILRLSIEVLQERYEAIFYINHIESTDQREVLRLRYIKCLAWWDILKTRGCDDLRSQMRLRDRAIESLQKIIDDPTIAP